MSLRRILDRYFPDRITRREYAEWATSGFAAPSPPHVKRATLLRLGLPEATWVETGTFMGDTTALLALRARRVHSIEPEPKLCARARGRFAKTPNVEIHGGLSEEILPILLARLEGDVCFWLDGHYSAGVTFKGPKDTPIAEELAAIEAGAQDFEAADEDGATLFITAPTDLDLVGRALPDHGFKLLSSKLGYRPKNPVSAAGLTPEQLDEVESFLAALDANEDVQNVFAGLGE